MNDVKVEEFEVGGEMYRVIPTAPMYAVALSGKVVTVKSKVVQEDCLSTKGIRTILLMSYLHKWYVTPVLDLIIQVWGDKLGALGGFLAEMSGNISKSRSKQFVEDVYRVIREKKGDGVTKAAVSQLFDVQESNIYRIMGMADREKEEPNPGGRVSFTKLSDK